MPFNPSEGQTLVTDLIHLEVVMVSIFCVKFIGRSDLLLFRNWFTFDLVPHTLGMKFKHI